MYYLIMSHISRDTCEEELIPFLEILHFSNINGTGRPTLGGVVLYTHHLIMFKP
jgi:hypothetical protein